ncbi:ABC transporter permease [Candidatus Bathyarchaeota archaeon]|nr:ABC transporter permease [Candidatus Bathyarchaeota archaeon]
MSLFLREALREFWRGSLSKLGVIFLSIVIIVSFYTTTTMPLDYGTRFWSNPVFWVNNPKAAPPEWVNTFVSPKLLEHKVLSTSLPASVDAVEGSILKRYSVSYKLGVEQFPQFFNLEVSNLTYHEAPPTLILSILKPDGYSIDLYTFIVERPFENESIPFIRYTLEPKRVLLSGEVQVARALSNFISARYGELLSPSQIIDIGYEQIIFGERSALKSFTPLKGTYTLTLTLASRNPNDNIGSCRFILGGQVYGLMGTDLLGRDLFSGLLFGFPVALLIGFATSVITTALGAGLGIMSGYIGGRIDDLIQRFSDIVNNFPQLPLLIFLTFIFGGKLWVIVLVLVAFGWPGLTIIVRSMVLSVKGAPFVESALAVGASRLRIMGRHIFPQVAPFILSQLIFYTPSAILSEAALSFLGLGDPTIPTWGQILEYGFRNGAVYLGYWWWILPPGLLIIYSAITFVFIAMGLEPVVNPRLRRWR